MMGGDVVESHSMSTTMRKKKASKEVSELTFRKLDGGTGFLARIHYKEKPGGGWQEPVERHVKDRTEAMAEFKKCFG